MTKRRLKKNVKKALIATSLSILFISVFFVSKNLAPKDKPEQEDEVYVMNAILDPITPVTNITEVPNIKRPYTSDKVKISKYFYDYKATSEEQERSLIYYENTYLQNSGIVYSSNEEFDVNAVYEGTVVDVKKDDILNNIVYISHNSNLTTIYYGLKDVKVKTNDHVNQSDIIGTSDTNKFSTDAHSLLFEVNYKGEVMNPESFYQMDITELN